MLAECSVAFCSPAKSLTFKWFNGKPLSWQEVKVLTSKQNAPKNERKRCHFGRSAFVVHPACTMTTPLTLAIEQILAVKTPCELLRVDVLNLLAGSRRPEIPPRHLELT